MFPISCWDLSCPFSGSVNSLVMKSIILHHLPSFADLPTAILFLVCFERKLARPFSHLFLLVGVNCVFLYNLTLIESFGFYLAVENSDVFGTHIKLDQNIYHLCLICLETGFLFFHLSQRWFLATDFSIGLRCLIAMLMNIFFCSLFLVYTFMMEFPPLFGMVITHIYHQLAHGLFWIFPALLAFLSQRYPFAPCFQVPRSGFLYTAGLVYLTRMLDALGVLSFDRIQTIVCTENDLFFSRTWCFVFPTLLCVCLTFVSSMVLYYIVFILLKLGWRVRMDNIDVVWLLVKAFLVY